jgi:hypothetical protein
MLDFWKNSQRYYKGFKPGNKINYTPPQVLNYDGLKAY